MSCHVSHPGVEFGVLLLNYYFTIIVAKYEHTRKSVQIAGDVAWFLTTGPRSSIRETATQRRVLMRPKGQMRWGLLAYFVMALTATIWFSGLVLRSTSYGDASATPARVEVLRGTSYGDASATPAHVEVLRGTSYGDASATPARVEVHVWPSNVDRVADGCRHVFLDLGANIGVHNRFLFEPGQYPRTAMQKVFDGAFGDAKFRQQGSAASGICAFAFEANPAHAERLKRLETCYRRRGFFLKVFVPVAVADNQNETLVFERKLHDNAVMWGGRVLPKSQALTFGQDTLSEFTEVPAFSIVEFIKKHVQHREYDRSGRGAGTVVVKMDIEGTEFTVLPHMERSGLLCKGTVDVITAEFHRKMPYFSRDPERFPTLRSFSEHFRGYGTRDTPYCDLPTRIDLRDSEAYLEDKRNPLERFCMSPHQAGYQE